MAAMLDHMMTPSAEVREIAARWLGLHPSEAHGEAEALRLSLWSAMLNQYRKENLDE
jgi:hypothetical protein